MAQSQTFYAPSGNPIRCYTFDNVSGNTIIDEMGNGNATLNDTSRNAIAAGGVIGNCVTPVGEGNSSQALGMADISTWRSLSVWALFPVVGTKIYDFCNGSSGPLLSRFSDNTLRHRNGAAVLATVSDSDYHHYALVFNAGSDSAYKLYIDGALVAIRTDGWRDALICLGGNVNIVDYQSPRMDVVQIYDFALSADDVLRLYDMEDRRRRAVLIQNYTEEGSLRSLLDQVYSLRFIFRVLLSQPYSLRLLAQLLQDYGDAPTFRRLCHQYYGSANILRRLCKQDYGDYLRLRSISDELWAYPAALRQVAEERYSIAGERLAALMAEGYDISDKALLRAMIDQVYVLPPGEGLEQQPALSVRADGVTLASVYHLSIEMDESQAWIVGEIHLADQGEFLLCHHLQTAIEIDLDATTYHLLVDTPRQSDPELARTEYYVTLISPAARLDAPSARPITRTFDGMMASSIANEMAALGGVTLLWQLVDWYIPPATLYANNETPLAIIRRLVEAVGGILQSLPDGTLLCRPEYPLDTVAWEGATPEYYLSDGDNFFSVDPAPEPRAGYNRFLIADRETASGVAMAMTPIDISASVKELRVSRVPWDSADVGLDTSGGWWVSIIEEGVAEEEVEDLVEIVAGEGRTTKPVYGVVSSDYQEADLGLFTVTEEGLVSTTSPENSLLRLTYTTRFYRFVAADARIEEVQFYPEVRS